MASATSKVAEGQSPASLALETNGIGPIEIGKRLPWGNLMFFLREFYQFCLYLNNMCLIKTYTKFNTHPPSRGGSATKMTSFTTRQPFQVPNNQKRLSMVFPCGATPQQTKWRQTRAEPRGSLGSRTPGPSGSSPERTSCSRKNPRSRTRIAVWAP